MKVEEIEIGKVKPNKDNPRIIKDEKFNKLVNSIKEFPQMLEIRPIVVNEEMVVLGGNMRLKACKEAGLKKVHIIKAENLSEEQQKEFIVKDNVGFGEWDWDMIGNEWDETKLEDWGLDVWKPEEEIEKVQIEKPDLSDEIKETFEVIVQCGNESEQEATFDKLMKGGYVCRVLTL